MSRYFRQLTSGFNEFLTRKTGYNVMMMILGGPFVLNVGYIYMKNFLLVDKIGERLYELKRGYTPVAFPADFTELIEDELVKYLQEFKPNEDYFDFSRISKEKRHSYNIMASGTFDPETLGHSGHPSGCAVFLPYYLTYNTPADVDQDFPRMKLFSHKEYDNTFLLFPQALRDVLVLSDNAKRYIMRRQFYELNSNIRTYNMLADSLAALSGMTFYHLMYTIPKTNAAFPKLPGHPLSLALITLLYMPFLAHRIRASLNRRVTKSVDLAVITEEKYRQGAVEYFEKCRERNRRLRKLLGRKGEKYYLENGEVRRHSEMTFAKRLELIKNAPIQFLPGQTPTQPSKKFSLLPWKQKDHTDGTTA